jgi:hypothetical protein
MECNQKRNWHIKVFCWMLELAKRWLELKHWLKSLAQTLPILIMLCKGDMMQKFWGSRWALWTQRWRSDILDEIIVYLCSRMVEQWNEGELKQVGCKIEVYCPISLWKKCYILAIWDPSENMNPSNYKYLLKVFFNIFK